MIKKESTKKIWLVGFILALILILGACGSTQDANKPPQDGEGETRVVTDMAGNKVTLPKEIKKVIITSWGEPFGILISLGRLDLVTGMCDTSRYPWIRHAFPEVVNIPDYGSFDKINVEEILKAEPDVILAPYASEETNKKLRDLGLPVYVTKVEDTDEYHEKELRALAELVGESERAEELIKHKHDLYDLVKERVSGIAEKDKKTVYIMRRTILEKHNNDWSSGQAVVKAGGINVAQDTDKGFETTTEALMAWNPQYIFQVIGVENNKEYFHEIAKNPAFKDIPAVKTKDVYTFPIGVNYWYMGAEGGLGALLVGKTLYPDLFQDINIREEANQFYKKFLNIELDDESYEVMLRGFDGAKSLRDL